MKIKRVGYVIRATDGKFMRGSRPSYCFWETDFSKARIYSTARGAGAALRHMREGYVLREARVARVEITFVGEG